jgi:CHRD domain
MGIRALSVRRAIAAAAVAGALATAPFAASSPAVAHGATQVSFTVMSGAQENPAADPDGFGVAVVRTNATTGELCYLLIVARLDGNIAAAHIHKAPAGVNGGIVVPLTAPVNGFVHACITVAPALAADIGANPSAYYVNVHTSVFPGGAVRGQLRG